MAMSFARSTVGLVARRMAAPAAKPVTSVCARAMATGTVKWFNLSKGYGFVTVDDEESDIFVHQSSINSNGFRFLREGERVEFDVVETDRGAQASNVSGLGGVPLDRGMDE